MLPRTFTAPVMVVHTTTSGKPRSSGVTIVKIRVGKIAAKTIRIAIFFIVNRSVSQPHNGTVMPPKRFPNVSAPAAVTCVMPPSTRNGTNRNTIMEVEATATNSAVSMNQNDGRDMISRRDHLRSLEDFSPLLDDNSSLSLAEAPSGS